MNANDPELAIAREQLAGDATPAGSAAYMLLIAASEQAGRWDDVIEITLDFAIGLAAFHQDERAAIWLDRATHLAIELGFDLEDGRFALANAEVLLASGRPRDAVAEFSRAAEEFQARRELLDAAGAFSRAAFCISPLVAPEHAIVVHRQSLLVLDRIAVQYPGAVAVASNHCTEIAYLFRSLGNRVAALEAFVTARSYLEQYYEQSGSDPDQQALAEIDVDIGYEYAALGRREDARIVWRVARQRFADLGAHLRVADCTELVDSLGAAPRDLDW